MDTRGPIDPKLRIPDSCMDAAFRSSKEKDK